jgi:uncharacterized membrane protein (UPF0136 family)
MTVQIAQAVLGFYAVMLVIGGIIGRVKAGSSASLIAGTVSALMIGACFGLTFAPAADRFAFVIAGAVSMLLAIFFSRKFLATGKFMPGGMMALISIGATITSFWAAALTD